MCFLPPVFVVFLNRFLCTVGSPYKLDQYRYHTGGGRSLKLSLFFESKLWHRRIHTGVIRIGKACPGFAQEPRKRRHTNQEQKRGSLVIGKIKRKNKKKKSPPVRGLCYKQKLSLQVESLMSQRYIALACRVEMIPLPYFMVSFFPLYFPLPPHALKLIG